MNFNLTSVLRSLERGSRGRREKGVYNKTPLETTKTIHVAAILIENYKLGV